jgi:uncharacterized OsmC-like protein
VNTIATAIDRLESALSRRADFGQSTNHSVTTLREGLCCSTEEGSWNIDSDLPQSLGGTGSAPSPGVLVRAALGSCLAMMYQLRAAKHGVELTSIRVVVEADSEIAGMLLCDTASPAGYTAIRYHVDIETPAPNADVLRVIDEADQLSPLLDVFTRANTVQRTTSIRATGS